MKDVPVVFVKANQAGIVLSVLALLLFREPWIAAALWAVQTVGLLSGGRANGFILIAKKLYRGNHLGSQAAELARFNNTLAVSFLSLSVLSFALGWTTAAYTFAVLLLGAAGAALFGYCIGCTVYFWLKQIKAGRRPGIK